MQSVAIPFKAVCFSTDTEVHSSGGGGGDDDDDGDSE